MTKQHSPDVRTAIVRMKRYDGQMMHHSQGVAADRDKHLSRRYKSRRALSTCAPWSNDFSSDAVERLFLQIALPPSPLEDICTSSKVYND